MLAHFSPQPTPFVGRTKELMEITARLENPDCRLVTLTGPGGSGKTRLAIEAASRIATGFAHGTAFVGLQLVTRSDLLVSTIAQALSLTLYGDDEPETQLFNFLREKSLLLVLDNFEHLLSDTTLLSALLDYAPGLKILVTSREALNLQEEWLYPLKGMSIPLSAYATSLEEYEAVQLFMVHARRVQPDFDLTREHEAVIRICRVTAGLPLAIELAASWLKGLTASQIAFEMQHNLDFLSTTTRNVEERHRSMRTVFDHSWKLMTENERQIFATMSVFRGGFDTAAAEQVAGASLATLVALVEKSLVQRESSDRFGIHELLRQYGMEKLAEYGETEVAHARHSRYFARTLLEREAALKQPQQLETMQAIESDFENTRLAWDWSVRNRQAENLHAMLNGLFLFGFLGRRHREIISIFQDSLEPCADDRPLFGRLLARRWGFLHWWFLADYQVALTGIEQALAIAEAGNNRFEMAFCHLMAAYALMYMLRFPDSLARLELSQTLFEAIDEPYYVGWVLHLQGYVYANLGQPDREIIYMERALTLALATNNRFSITICLYNLGSIYVLNGDYVKGRHFATESLQYADESGHPCQIAHTLSLLALLAFCQGDYATARDFAERSQTMIKDILFMVIQPYSLSLLIVLACLREDYADAVRLNELAKRHVTTVIGFQLLFWALAALSCGLGRPAEARGFVQKLLQMTAPDANSATTLWIVPCVAFILAETDPEKAVELLAWVFAHDESNLRWIRQWQLLDRLQAQLQTMMERESHELHREKGEALSVAALTAYLRQAFGTPSDHTAELAQGQLLTARESEILLLLAAGLTNPQIAERLVIGAGTVKSHTLSIYRKLDVANRTQAIVRAQALGLLV